MAQGRRPQTPTPELVAIIAYLRAITPRRRLLSQVPGPLVDGTDRRVRAEPQGLQSQRHRVIDLGNALLQQRGGHVEAYEGTAPRGG